MMEDSGFDSGDRVANFMVGKITNFCFSKNYVKWKKKIIFLQTKKNNTKIWKKINIAAKL